MGRIDSIGELRSRYRDPVERTVKKELDHLDRHCREQRREKFLAQMEAVVGFLRTAGPTMSAFNAWIALSGLETMRLRVEAQSASALLDYLSGWSLPIEEMPLWLKGVASTGSFNHQWDAQGRLSSFTLKDSQQRDWQVSYGEFFPDALALPKRIQLDSKTDGSRIKLVVRKWQL